jgi:spore coat polysaccharide biosynthesis protein SpsF
MRIGAIIQARMSSRRLPGKVLLELGGRPILQRVVERVRAAPGIDHVAVATSSDASDGPVEELCRRIGVRSSRGPLEHVAERLCRAAEALRLDVFVRVCADSPLIDPALIGEAVACMRACASRSDVPGVVTNVLPRTFPPGQSVEVIRTSVLRSALEQMRDPAEREHVTLHFYRRPARFCVERIISPMEVRDASMVVDEAADIARLEALFASAPQAFEEAGWLELAQRLRMLNRQEALAAV